MAISAATAYFPPSLALSSDTRWTLELLRDLDWKRFQELVALLLLRTGFQAEIAWIRPDAAVVMTVTHPTQGGTDALVQCPAWNLADTPLAPLRDLHHAVLEAGAARGIFITPGDFSAEARAYARNKPLELIDGRDLLRTLSRLSPEEHAYYLRIATVGQYNVPSCPECARKMELREDTAADEDYSRRDLVFRERLYVGTEVHSRSITVQENAEVLFMKGVECGEMTVKGRATGNIVVHGRLTVTNGAVLSGLVAAKSIRLDPGGVLEAEARILNSGEVKPLRPIPVSHVWMCPRAPKCRVTLPLR